MRVRTRRFDGLRSGGELWEAHPFEKLVRKCNVDGHAGVSPPSPGVAGDFRRRSRAETAFYQLSKRGLATFPLFELVGAEPMTDPLVEVRELPRRLGDAEVSAPPEQVASEGFDDLLQTAPTRPARKLPDAALHGVKCLRRHPSADDLS